MNGKDILIGFCEIEETYIHEAEQSRPSRFEWAARILASAAAVFCVLVGGMLSCFVMFAIFTPGRNSDPGNHPYGAFLGIGYGVSGSGAVEDLDEMPFEVQYFQTDGTALQENQIVVISSVRELEAFCQRNRDALGLHDEIAGFRQLCNTYDAQFFEKQLLVIVSSRESDDLVSRRVHGVYADTKDYSEGDWIIAIRNKYSREAQAPKSMNYLILLELYVQDGFNGQDGFVVWEYNDVIGE